MVTACWVAQLIEMILTFYGKLTIPDAQCILSHVIVLKEWVTCPH